MKNNQLKNQIIFRNYDILRYPITTEKSTAMSENGQYFFVVRKDATKKDIKDAVEHIFDVKVKSVNTLIRKGKIKTFRGRQALLSDKKRAIVRLEDGESITLVSGV